MNILTDVLKTKDGKNIHSKTIEYKDRILVINESEKEYYKVGNTDDIDKVCKDMYDKNIPVKDDYDGVVISVKKVE